MFICLIRVIRVLSPFTAPPPPRELGSTIRVLFYRHKHLNFQAPPEEETLVKLSGDLLAE